MPGTLFVVATPIGNLEDITLRALRVLREVALIAAEDTRRTGHLLARHAIVTPTTSLHEHNEAGKTHTLIARMQRGDSLALVSDAGTPTVSDPGGRLIRAAIDAGLRVEPVPGPSAVLAALSASGLPTDSFMFMGFPPIRSKDRKLWFERVKAIRGTIVFFEAPHRIEATLDEFRRDIGDCDVAIGRELTKAHEQLVRGPITTAIDQLTDRRGEFTVVIQIGLKTENSVGEPFDPSRISEELRLMTVKAGVTKRKAIGILARKHGLQPNEIYDLLEASKKSV